MSFNWHARKARDPKLTLTVRRSALRSCMLRLGWLTGERYLQVTGRFDAQFGFNIRESTEEQLLAVLTAVEREGNLVLEKVRVYERKRIREKMRGKRRPSKADEEALNESLKPANLLHADT